MENNNFITIQGWMVNELKLKGNDLLVYAIIYGFSQNGQGKFTGSAQYLADWCGSTKRGVFKNLNSLVDRGLIIKEEQEKNGIKFCDYSVPKFIPSEQSSSGGSELSSPHNINNIIKKTISKDIVKEIVDYLNDVCSTRYKHTSKNTIKHIAARLNEGYTVDDFKKVIDNKHGEWGDNPQMCQYLRPDTLFGSKFESYLNQKTVANKKPGIEISEKQRKGMVDIVEW